MMSTWVSAASSDPAAAALALLFPPSEEGESAEASMPSPSQSKRTASASARSSVKEIGAAPHRGGSALAISTSPGARMPGRFCRCLGGRRER